MGLTDRCVEKMNRSRVMQAERLTERVNGVIIVKEDYGEDVKYGDTNLTSEQLTEIDKLYAEKCREVAELKKQIDVLLNDNLVENEGEHETD